MASEGDKDSSETDTGKSTDFDQCATEVIHKLNVIQDFGVLLVFERLTGKIVGYSENINRYVKSKSVLLGSSILRFIKGEQHLYSWIDNGFTGDANTEGNVQLEFLQGGAKFEAIARQVPNNQNLILLELMPIADLYDGLSDNVDEEVFARFAEEIKILDQSDDFEQFSQQSVKLLKEYLGYSRVMLYQFDEKNNGEVIAESVSLPFEDQYLGLHFPESDIPKQARELYKKNKLRIIASVDKAPVPLVIKKELGLLDQTHSLLRQPAVAHIQYCKNIGVKSTLTVSLIYEGRLWGMLACHHHEELVPTISLRRKVRVICQLICNAINGKLNQLMREHEIEEKRNYQDFLQSIEENFKSGSARLKLKALCQDVLKISASDACAIKINGRWTIAGNITEQNIKSLIDHHGGDDWHAERMDDLPGSVRDLGFAGVVVRRISEAEDAYLVILRNEQVVQIKWGGNPKEKTLLDNGKLGPRRSFEMWQQTIKGGAKPWESELLKFTFKLASVVRQALVALRLKESKDALTMLGDCLAHINDMVVILGVEHHRNEDLNIVYANEAFVKHFGFENFDIIGSSFSVFYDSIGVDAELLGSIKNRENQLSNHQCFSFVGKDKQEFYCEVSISPIANDQGCVNKYVLVLRDISDKKNAEKKIQKLAYFDALTGLLNRHAFYDRCDAIRSESKRHGYYYCLLYIDLDRFKMVNDSKGHLYGDQLLKNVSARIKECVREEDVLARLGGDEFTVVVHGYDNKEKALEAAQTLGNKIVENICRPFDLNGYFHRLSCSIGIALCEPNSEETIGDVVKKADMAMYRAKSTRQGSICFYDQSIQEKVSRLVQMEQALRTAVENHQLNVFYQPIVNARRDVVGFEALSRWNSNELGDISPAEFIPLAERSNLIVDIGDSVLGCVSNILGVSQVYNPSWTVALNVSPKQIEQGDFVDKVLNSLKENNVNARRLVIEITESIMLENMDAAINMMTSLGKHGVQFSLDDFGTGYSSLAYLKKLPINKLKIDRTFVKDILNNDESHAISSLVINLAKTIGRDVVAEGIELTEQHNLLESLGCDYFQGFEYGQAAPIRIYH